MRTYVTRIRMSPPASNKHEHIAELEWRQGKEVGTASRIEMVKFINWGNGVFVRGNPDARVYVVDATPPYLRTRADRTWTNNLLSLRRF